VGGAVVGGPVGAVVGGVGGAIVGGIADDRRSQFNTYVVKERRNSYKYDRDVVAGAELPSSGVTYYEVPSEYGVKNYRYTVVNNRTVLVDPHSHRIVQIIEERSNKSVRKPGVYAGFSHASSGIPDFNRVVSDKEN